MTIYLTSHAPRPGARLITRGVVVAALASAIAFAAPQAAHGDAHNNDLFANATPLEVGDTVTVDTRDATTGEDEDFAAEDACGSPPPDATVWWTVDWTDVPTFLEISAIPPQFITPGFNVVVDNGGGGFECVAGGPVAVSFLAEPGTTYFIQSIDDQIPPDWDGNPANLDTENGGDLTVTLSSLGVAEPEICPGLIPNDPEIPPGLNRVFGTDGDDDLRGTNGDDLIIGLAGDDEIDGRGGNDVIVGCDGDDEIDAGSGDDVVFGDNPIFGDLEATGGDDEIDAGRGNDTVFGGPGNDEIEGDEGDDELFGQSGDDEIDAGRGNDFAVGGFGEDEVDGGPGDDQVFGGFDSDEVDGGPGDDFVSGDVPAPIVDESDHTDECEGGGGNDEFDRCEVIDGDDNDDDDDDDSDDD